MKPWRRLVCRLSRSHDDRRVVGREECLARGLGVVLHGHMYGHFGLDTLSETSYLRCRRCGRTEGRTENAVHPLDDPRFAPLIAQLADSLELPVPWHTPKPGRRKTAGEGEGGN